MKKFLWILITLLLLGSPSKAEITYDAALVLAMDVSSSITDINWELQRNGLANAIESKEFITSVRVSFLGKILISVVEWSDSPIKVIDWTVLEEPEDFIVLASKIRTLKRVQNGSTCMIKALHFSALELNTLEGQVARKIIDVSGDGKDNCAKGVDDPLDTKQASNFITNQGITINGLPIITPQEPYVDDFYADYVIGGPGSFMVVVDGFKDFETVMKKKLIIEVSSK